MTAFARRRPVTTSDFILAAIVLIALAHFGLSYSGPYRWTTELQLAWFGSYSVKMTLVFSALILLLPLAALRWIARRVIAQRPGASGPIVDALMRPIAPPPPRPRWHQVAS